MEGRNERGRAITKVPSSACVIALFDQNRFKGQYPPLNHVGMNRIEDSAFTTIPNEHDQATLWSQHTQQPAKSGLEPIKVLRDRWGCGEIVGMVAVLEARPIRGMPEH